MTEAVATGNMLLQGGYITKLTNRSSAVFKNNNDFYTIVKKNMAEKDFEKSAGNVVGALAKDSLLTRAARKVQKRVSRFTSQKRVLNQKAPTIALRSLSIHEKPFQQERNVLVPIKFQNSIEQCQETSSEHKL